MAEVVPAECTQTPCLIPRDVLKPEIDLIHFECCHPSTHNTKVAHFTEIFNPLSRYMLESSLEAITAVSLSGYVSKSFAHLFLTNSLSSVKLVVDYC